MSALRKRKLQDRPYAAALRYRLEDDPAPRLVAKGMGAVADKIIAAARDAGIPLYEDPDLVAVLMTLDVNDLVPPDLYVAVAEVLAFIYRMNNRVRALGK